MDFETVSIIGGGTVAHVRPHLALSAPAYGKTPRLLDELVEARWGRVENPMFEHHLYLTKMANGGIGPETNEDVSKLVQDILLDPTAKVLFMPVALCDFDGSIVGDKQEATPSGKDQERLKTGNGPAIMYLTPADKVINQVRKERKDIFLVGFKTTAGATRDEQYIAALTLLKKNSCNLVFANDLHTKLCMIVTPEQARYHETTDKTAALTELVDMAYLRSRNTFTRSTVVEGDPVAWTSPEVPESLRTVVNHCIQRGAYKPFMGSTVGHFAVKTGPGEFLTSRRKTNFTQLERYGLVKIVADGLTKVTAFGSKPSVGGQSQRIIFEEFGDTDCIVHFHCPMKFGSQVPVQSQRQNECGSHECGKNTANGLKKFGNLYAVFLDKHGPNIVFNRNTDPAEVIRFIEDNFILDQATDGVLLAPRWTQSSASSSSP